MKLTQTYKEVATYYGTPQRDRMRHWALNALSWGTPLYGGGLYQPRIQFLYFHHIFDDEAANFERLVANLAQDHTFISHTEAVNRLVEGKIDRPYISWSSDDGLWTNLKAAEILKEYGASCCFYLNPQSIGLTNFQQIREFCASKLHMPPSAFLDWKGVETLLQMGHEIGSHTLNHDRVTTMAPQVFLEDLMRSKQLLEAHCGAINHFAYPYGRFTDFSAQAHAQVFQAGYESCATAVRGCHVAPKEGVAREDLFIRRDQVIGAWPIPHVRYFMAKSSKNASIENNYLPQSYFA